MNPGLWGARPAVGMRWSGKEKKERKIETEKKRKREKAEKRNEDEKKYGGSQVRLTAPGTSSAGRLSHPRSVPFLLPLLPLLIASSPVSVRVSAPISSRFCLVKSAV